MHICTFFFCCNPSKKGPMSKDLQTAKANLQLAKESFSLASKQAVEAIKKVVLVEEEDDPVAEINADFEYRISEHDSEKKEEKQTENTKIVKDLGIFFSVTGFGIILYLILNIWGSVRLSSNKLTSENCSAQKWGTFANTIGWLAPMFGGLPSIYAIANKY